MKKQKKLIDSTEEDEEKIEEKVEEKQEVDPDFGEHYMEDMDHDYRSLKSSVDYNDEEYRHQIKLEEKLYETFHNSRWCALGHKKKIPKDLIPFIFQEMFEGLQETDFSMVEKFVGICDFMEITYLKAYDHIHMKYKEDIVTEMDKKYNLLGRKRIKKIF